jgi:hypothetical protein
LVGESQDEKKNELATRIYSEVCINIRATDEISFRLLGLVPLVSAAGIFGISLNKEFATSPLAVVISFFAAIVTGALLMWEWRNLKSCRSYLSYAMLLEKYVLYDALGKLGEKVPLDKSAPDVKLMEEIKTAQGQFRSRPDTKVIRKTIAELIIYSATISAWIAIGIMALIT